MGLEHNADWPPWVAEGGAVQSGGPNTVYCTSNAPPASASPRAWALRHAESLIDGRRDKDYGSPIENFGRAAGTLSALGYRSPDGSLIAPHDIAIIMEAIKLARLAHDWRNSDTWVDVIGYGGCGYEVTVYETTAEGT